MDSPQSLLKALSLADTLTLGFLNSRTQDTTFVLFKVTELVLVCYSGNRRDH